MPVINRENESLWVKLDVPHEPGESIWVRPLPWSELRKAKELVVDAFLNKISSMPGFMDQMMKDSDGRKSGKEIDPEDEYDNTALLVAAVAKWSYPETVAAENIEGLDPKTKAWLLQEVIQRNILTETQGEVSASRFATP